VTALTLAEFLLARIAEDEADARAASRVRETRTGDTWKAVRGRHGLDRITRTGGAVGDVMVETARHVARHDPARVLAECEAKRRIVDLSKHGCGDDYERVQRALALPYAEHLDYRKEWRI
jgi:hypothetical protein